MTEKRSRFRRIENGILDIINGLDILLDRMGEYTVTHFPLKASVTFVTMLNFTVDFHSGNGDVTESYGMNKP